MTIPFLDEHTIKKINTGDLDAFTALYEAYYTYLNMIAVYYVIDANIGGEIVDDVFINIWDKRYTLSYPAHSFLVRSVKNGCLNYIRKQQSVQRTYDEYMEISNMLSSEPFPLQYLEMKEIEQEIQKTAELLPPQCKAVFDSYFYNGQSAAEIAANMNININTVRVQLKKAMDMLKKQLKHFLSVFL